jgi:hypothetical protein
MIRLRWLLLPAVLVACSKIDDQPASTPNPQLTVLELSTEAFTASVGTSTPLFATGSDRVGHAVACPIAITWSSAVPAVATVSATGVVTGVAPGSAVITATCLVDGTAVTASATATIQAVAVASIEITGAPTSPLVPSATVPLATTIKDASGAVLAGSSYVVSWSSSVPAVATVSAAGVVAAVSAGSTTITARIGTLESNVGVSVVNGAVIGAAGGSLTSPDGNVTFTFPAGALAQPVPFAFVTATGAPTNPYLLGTPYALSPAATPLLMPVMVSLHYDPAKEPVGTPEGTNSLGVVSGGSWSTASGSSVDVNAHIVQASLQALSAFVSTMVGAAWLTSDDYYEGDLGTFSGYLPSAQMCVGEYYFQQVAGMGQGYTVASSKPAVVSASGFLSGYAIISGLSPGSATVKLTAAGVTSVTQVSVAGCSQPIGMFFTAYSGTNDNIAEFQSGLVGALPITATNNANAVAAGVAASTGGGPSGSGSLRQTTDNTPVAYHLTNGATYTEQIYWSGVSGVATAVVPPANSSNFAGAFVDHGPFLFAPNVGGVSEVWGVPLGGNAATKLTNLGGTVTYVATSPDGSMYFDWHPNTIGVPAHIFRLSVPTIGGTVPTSGQVQVSPTTAGAGETQPAVSQNGRLVAYAMGDAALTYSRVMVQNVSQPGSAPTLISPATGFAYVPAFCGNGTVYFAYSSSFSGQDTLMKWNPATATSVAVAALAGTGIANLAVARTDGDGGRHICP